MKFLNTLLDASTNTNIRVFLQHELEAAGLDIQYMTEVNLVDIFSSSFCIHVHCSSRLFHVCISSIVSICWSRCSLISFCRVYASGLLLENN